MGSRKGGCYTQGLRGVRRKGWDGGKGGKRGWKEQEGNPKGGKGCCPLRNETWTHLLGQAGRRMEAAWPSWREERKTGISWMRPPQGSLWDRSSLSQGWAAGQGARRGVRAQGGTGKEHPNRKGWISSTQGFLGCSGLLQSALILPIMGH